jgi:hypothetical protein
MAGESETVAAAPFPGRITAANAPVAPKTHGLAPQPHSSTHWFAGAVECGFVHDTLDDRRPYRILVVRDHWSRSSPVPETGFRMSSSLVNQILNRVLSKGRLKPCHYREKQKER